jgi:hypothetical protein
MNKMTDLGMYMTNDAHQLQEDVSEFINCPLRKESANKVINQAGQIENEGRAIIKNVVLKSP